jgi:hypothetical protein
LFVGACSFAFMAPPTAAMTSVCDDGYQAPVTDTILGSAVLATAAGIATFGHVGKFSTDERAAYWLGLVPAALLVAGSAVYGYLSRDHCEHVRAAPSVAAKSEGHDVSTR